MAYPITDHIALIPASSAVGSYAPDLSIFPTTTDDDYVFLCVSCSSTSGTLSISGAGWTEAVELDVASGNRMAVYWCKVAAGTVAAPTISLSAGTGLWQCTAWVERDCNVGTADTPLDGTATADLGGLGSSVTSGTFTPSSADCRVIYFTTTRTTGSESAARMVEASTIGAALQAVDDGTVYICSAIGYVSQGAAAATAKTIYANGASRRIGCITFAIKNKTSGKRAPFATPGVSRVAWCGDFGAAFDGTLTPTVSSWGNPTSRNINSIRKQNRSFHCKH